MTILDSLKFVRGAVAKKDFVPVLQHYCIRNGIIQSFNGTIGLCSPVAVDLETGPNGVQFAKAIEACGEAVTSLYAADNGKLIVRTTGFQVMVDCIGVADFPDITPRGKLIDITDDLLPALTYLEPCIAEDASRPWACGILFDGDSAYATNNVILQQYWLGYNFPVRVNLPAAAVREVLRIGEKPLRLQLDTNRLVFHYPNNRWLCTQLLEGEWPDISGLFDRTAGYDPKPFPEFFFEAVEQLMPFADDLGRIYFHGNCMSTSPEPDKAGALIEMACPPEGCFNGKHLLKLRGTATEIDFTAYPDAVPFVGGAVRGVIAGLRS